jgi:hypothetical protein
MEAWDRELQIVMREQAVSQMIQESYVKEIDRVRKQQMRLAAAEEELKLDFHGAIVDLSHSASNAAHRFATHKRVQQRGKGNSSLRRAELAASSQL